MASSGQGVGRRNGHPDHVDIPGEEGIYMKFFRPDQDQFTMFILNKIHRCQICDAECDTSRIVAWPGCCNCLVHLECFNALATYPNSASTFGCPKCDRELSGESIRAAWRRVSPKTVKENGEEDEDEEMMLGSMATKNITAIKRIRPTQACGHQGALHHRKETPRSSNASSDSTDVAGGAGPPLEASPEEEMERKLVAKRNKANRSRDFFSWLLTMIAGGSPGQDTQQKEIQDGPTRSFYSHFMT